MSIITKNIDLAISCLREEGIVAIPTETVYGLAGNALNDNAIKKIFAMKNRPANHPLIMHIAKDWALTRWANTIPEYAYKLIEAFWPGPLTIVFNCKPGAVSPLITGGQNTVAIRCPAHPLAQSLLTALDFPLVAPSANPFGKISPTTAVHVLHSFRDESLLILDGGRAEVGIESTIVSATNPLGYQILRHGMIDEQAIQAVLPHSQLPGTSAIRVPGKLDSHYQPEKPLYCFEKKELIEFCRTNSAVYVLSFNKDTDFKTFAGYQLPESPEELAYELYHQLRCADKSSAPLIAMELPPEEEQWEGIRERVLKASTKS
ncbi:MAG: L-threonylcarbamoyladenylate synthase [Legionella sp.]|nr:L-threonylcarbamoyladenylate synthase [Legionella sp.]